MNESREENLKLALSDLLSKAEKVHYLPSETKGFHETISYGDVRILATLSTKPSGGIICNFIDISVGFSNLDMDSIEILDEIDNWETETFDPYQKTSDLISKFVLSTLKNRKNG